MQASRALGLGLRLRSQNNALFTVRSALAQRSAVATRANARNITLKVIKPTEEQAILNSQRLKRPESPHLTIYQPQITWVLSGLNRATGGFLSVGLYGFFIAYLAAPVIGLPFDSAAVVEAAHSLPEFVKTSAKAIFAAPFVFHSLNGLRHLTWDSVKLLTVKSVTRSGWAVVGATAVGTGYLVFFIQGHSAAEAPHLRSRLTILTFPTHPALLLFISYSNSATLVVMKFMLFPELAQLSQALTHSSQECTVHTRIEAYSCKPIKKDKKLSKAMENNFQDLKAEIKHSIGSPGDEDDDALYASPFGHLNKPQSRKTLYLLIQLLNLAFPDYDFSEAKPDHFCKEVNGQTVLSSLSATLNSVRTQSGPHLVYAPRSYATYPPTGPEFYDGSPSSSLTKSPMISAASSPTSSMVLPKSLPSSTTPVSSGIHPLLFQVLDKVISLAQCDVYSYQPDMESDPHADDSDSDDESSEFSSPDDEDYDFLGFEDFNSSSPPKPGFVKAPYGSWDDDEGTGATDNRSPSRRMSGSKSGGGLLWSSHWFFHNRKLKRMLFITIWAKKRRGFMDSSATSESFVGWEGAVGAGARALGLRAREV